VDILGKVETTPPDAHADVSVVDPNTGRAIEDLSEANFAVQVSGQDVRASVSSETSGVAVVMIIDRGGIARAGDPRAGQAVELANALLDMLDLDGSPSADMAALIGIRGREEGGLTPLAPFTDYDPNALRNEFDKIRTEVVNEVTPLYDGIDQAIAWIAENDDADSEEKLAHRRPIIVIFSDGIDNQFSSESHETIIINKCLQHGIMLYAVRMEAPGRSTDADNMEALAVQTHGRYMTHSEETRAEVLNLFENIVTQRQTYRVTFPLYRPQGDYQVRIQVVDTPIGNGSDEATVSSPLQIPKITLATPGDDVRYTVPYSKTTRGFLPTFAHLSVQVTSNDGAERLPSQVRYFANGVLIGASDTPPDFPFEWNLSRVVTPSTEIQRQAFTLLAEADDPYLDGKMTSQPVSIQATWEERVVPVQQTLVEEGRQNWWLLLMLAALLMGLLLLFAILIKTRGELARKVAVGATGALSGVTKRLGGASQQAPGKLVILQGANVGQELRLSANVTKVGRDPQFSDFALYDEYTSNPHFSIQLEQTQFYITDEGSTNGTRVNGMPIPPHQRVLLQPDAMIEVGQTRLQLKRLGGATRRLGSQAPSEASPQPTPSSMSAPTQRVGSQAFFQASSQGDSRDRSQDGSQDGSQDKRVPPSQTIQGPPGRSKREN